MCGAIPWCPKRDSNPYLKDFKSFASADWATGAWSFPPALSGLGQTRRCWRSYNDHERESDKRKE